MSLLDIFVRQNGYQLNASNDEIVEVALLVAGRNPQNDYTFDEFVQWIKNKLTKK
jgi:prophage maintenance system killer protein